MEFLRESFTLDLRTTLVDFLRVGVAFALALPVAWERYCSGWNMGLRTFPLVAVGSCGFLLIAKHTPGADADTQARVIQGLLSGIGFIGGGAILKQGSDVRGLATAAGIWCTGAVGAAVAYERVEIAVVMSLITFVTLRMLTPPAGAGRRPQSREENDHVNGDTGGV
jgi:putative Mg2+ transporter-C (MgtC) family protein